MAPRIPASSNIIDESKNENLTPFAKSAPIHTEDVALFTTPPVNVGEDKIMWVQHEPTFMSQNGSSSIQFNISGTGSQYTDLSKTQLYLKLKILDEDKKSIFPQSRDFSALPIDMILHTMWSSIDIKLNQTLVTSSNTNYMYKAYIEGILNYSENAKRLQMHSIGLSGEKFNFDQTNPTLFPKSSGLAERIKYFQNLRYVPNYIKDDDDEDTDQLDPLQPYKEEIVNVDYAEFIGPLMADLCYQDKLIINRVDIDIKFWPNRDEFRLITFPDGKKAYLAIEDVKLYVCKVTVAPETYVGHDKGLQESNAKYPYLRSDIITYNILKGAYSDTIEDPFQGEIPSQLIIGLVDSEAYHGNFHLNPLAFKNFNLSTIAFYIDGESVPREPFEFNFKNNEYLAGYLSLYEVTGKLNENTDIGIDRQSYKEGYCLIGFNCDPTSATDFTYIGKTKTGRGRLKLRFHEGLDRSITVIIYAKFPEVMEIDKYRTVTLRERDKV